MYKTISILKPTSCHICCGLLCYTSLSHATLLSYCLVWFNSSCITGFQMDEGFVFTFLTTYWHLCWGIFLFCTFDPYLFNKSASLHDFAISTWWATPAICAKNATRKHEHITPVLPVPFRIDFRILLLIFKVLNGLAPPYLSELLNIHTPVRALRSSNQMVLDVPRSTIKNRGDQAFSVAAPNVWKSLPL